MVVLRGSQGEAWQPRCCPPILELCKSARNPTQGPKNLYSRYQESEAEGVRAVRSGVAHTAVGRFAKPSVEPGRFGKPSYSPVSHPTANRSRGSGKQEQAPRVPAWTVVVGGTPSGGFPGPLNTPALRHGTMGWLAVVTLCWVVSSSPRPRFGPRVRHAGCGWPPVVSPVHGACRASGGRPGVDAGCAGARAADPRSRGFSLGGL
jgi:hypothetical protein